MRYFSLLGVGLSFLGGFWATYAPEVASAKLPPKDAPVRGESALRRPRSAPPFLCADEAVRSPVAPAELAWPEEPAALHPVAFERDWRRVMIACGLAPNFRAYCDEAPCILRIDASPGVWGCAEVSTRWPDLRVFELNALCGVDLAWPTPPWVTADAAWTSAMNARAATIAIEAGCDPRWVAVAFPSSAQPTAFEPLSPAR